jgi:hypothetical protein
LTKVNQSLSLHFSSGIILNLESKMDEIEVWKDVIGYEGLYQVSDLGRVKSFNYNHTGEIKILKNSLMQDGYQRVQLWKNQKGITFKVHRLVALHFIPNPENKPEVNHIFGNKWDNRACVLEWATSTENNNHALNTKLRVMPSGEDHPGSKLTKNQIIEIKNKYKPYKYSQHKIAKEYGVSQALISLIIQDKS